jgi:hypothetical protein
MLLVLALIFIQVLMIKRQCTWRGSLYHTSLLSKAIETGGNNIISFSVDNIGRTNIPAFGVVLLHEEGLLVEDDDDGDRSKRLLDVSEAEAAPGRSKTN